MRAKDFIVEHKKGIKAKKYNKKPKKFIEPIKPKAPEAPKTEKNTESAVAEKWTAKYKRSINCNNPKGFSQRAHCQGRKK